MAAVRPLSLCFGADASDYYCQARGKVALKSIKQFVKSIQRIFGAKYLRAPTATAFSGLSRHVQGSPAVLGVWIVQDWLVISAHGPFSVFTSGKMESPSVGVSLRSRSLHMAFKLRLPRDAE